MKHMAWGAVALLGAASLAGCYSYAADAVNNHNFNTVQATPSFSTLKVGDSDQVIVRLVNDNNTGAVTSYTISNVGSGIAVHYVANYRPIYDAGKDTLVNTTDKDAQEYYIVGLALGRYTFTIKPTSVNTAATTTVNVLVEPANLFSALNKHAAVPGDTVTVTAPAGLVFTNGDSAHAGSAVTFGSGTPVTIVSRAADSSSITFVVGGGIAGPASVSLVSQPTAPNVAPVTLATADTLITTPIPSPIPVTVSSTNLTLGQPLTVTLGGGLRFLRNSTVSIGQLKAPITSISADSLTAIVAPAAGSNDSIAFTNIAFVGYHPAPALKTASDTISAGAISAKGDKVITTQAAPLSVPTTLSASTGPASSSFTVTVGGGVLRFGSASDVTVGGASLGIASISADSLTATVLAPFPSALNAVAFTNLSVITSPSTHLSVPSDGKTFTSTAATTVPVAGGVADFTGSGLGTCQGAFSSYFGGGTCHYYTITLGATPVTSTITWTGPNQDLGVYLFDSAGTGCKYILADNNGSVAGSGGDNGVNSSCTTGAPNTMVAGTYTLVVVDFTSGVFPTAYHVHLSQ